MEHRQMAARKNAYMYIANLLGGHHLFPPLSFRELLTTVRNVNGGKLENASMR